MASTSKTDTPLLVPVMFAASTSKSFAAFVSVTAPPAISATLLSIKLAVCVIVLLVSSRSRVVPVGSMALVIEIAPAVPDPIRNFPLAPTATRFNSALESSSVSDALSVVEPRLIASPASFPRTITV